MFLEKIVNVKKKEVELAKRKVPLAELEKSLDKFKPVSFAGAISKSGEISLIAEIKKCSPSSGILREDFNPEQIAKIYAQSGAAAISVLTDEKFFGGNLGDLTKVKSAVGLPVLRKEFIIDIYQIYESKAFGADAILLIAELLTLEQLKGFLKKARELELDVLVEAHDLENLKKALEADVGIVGINNRNLNDFKVDLSTSEKLVAHIPQDKIRVSESGIKSHADVEFLKSLGVDTVLIGEAFMRAPDIEKKVKEIMQGA